MATVVQLSVQSPLIVMATEGDDITVCALLIGGVIDRPVPVTFNITDITTTGERLLREGEILDIHF